MDVIQFTQQLIQNMGDYKRENSWFTNGVTRSTYEYTRRREDSLGYYIKMAWKIYSNVLEGQVDPIFLGNSEIRQQQDHILSFGILSATERAQDTNVNAIIDNAAGQRATIFAGAATDLQDVPATTETGAILSSVGWSPMMNDAMIIAGISRAIEFIYILSDEEQAFFKELVWRYERAHNKVGNSAVIGSQQWNADRQHRADQVWLSFFKTEPDALWRDGIPRMFVREMLGLKHFGYRSILDETQITFRREQSPAVSFSEYLNCLRDVGFHTNDKPRILSSIGQYLFNDPGSLSTL